MGEMNWVSRKIHLYNVTMGLYMLDCRSSLTGEDMMVLILLWFVCFNGSRFASDVFDSHLKARIIPGGNYGLGIEK
ncbi:Os07g0446900 [Oryza sativa Japonica Group]|uniref:Os07g0446900 protein n=4 Tax=Oryza TaxID=4527 RepID=Q0D6S0_ORYSJ|nr:Os07g0446900 [Oryza sativa Japonica Group]|eukprot:NP_001059539.1 Os07g0446900 [Oryza sativa Japonica Group]